MSPAAVAAIRSWLDMCVGRSHDRSVPKPPPAPPTPHHGQVADATVREVVAQLMAIRKSLDVVGLSIQVQTEVLKAGNAATLDALVARAHAVTTQLGASEQVLTDATHTNEPK